MVTEADNYIPYGEEWEKEMMKLPKKFLIDMIRKRGSAEKALVLKEALEKIVEVSSDRFIIDTANEALNKYNQQ